ncbi:protein O-GlcNAcase [Condylostylus longicornis]|uniref:protein O-GlcNAcase n=1 Tax=Condylostylus longicornis TaxID=2530218 RepID=UPI00244E4A0D|nr:protein O-GlcNAcase [Condylostylus longicornis]
MASNSDQKNGNFICGVVEGFYGRPWTTEQRKDLFRKLKKWGMCSYVYAPKDDYKHRAYWRELYTVEEAENLLGLITAAKEQGIAFYYALSPGLDMSYSSAKEVQTLKRKLEQVSQFGCEAFALLFDDIESELSKADKEIFQTFANAQVSVTNEIFSHLNSPRFLFCPTQYCSSRAVPTVADSEYLNTIGSKLYPEIDILWTGNKVISKTFSVQEIQEITEVLRRPPVIWDNLHANDYDQKRVFLGPYSGRSPELIPLLRGVLTNPNCEFHANTIAIHTLASWSKCSADTKINNSISADIKLETENDDGVNNGDIPSCLSENIYHPRVALKNAILEWLPEFSVQKDAWGPITKPQPPVTMVMPILPIIPSINTCMSLTTTTTTTATSNSSKVPEVNTTQLQALADVCCNTATVTNVPSISNTVMNSLVSATKIVTNDDIPNHIAASTVTHMEIPKKMPISSIPVPIMSLKNHDEKSNDSTKSENDVELEEVDEEKKINEKNNENNANEEETIENSELEKSNIEEDVPIVEITNTINLKNEIVEEKSDAGERLIPKNDNNMVDENLSPISVAEPMECGSSLASQISPKDSGKPASDDVVMSETVSTNSAGSMQVESTESLIFSHTEVSDDIGSKNISIEDIYLLCDLFYLPFEHGGRGLQILNEFNWLKTHAHVLLHSSKKNQDNSKPEVQEWMERSEKFYDTSKTVMDLLKKIAKCPNKELSYDLYSYVWDMACVTTLLNAFIKWIALGHFPANINSYITGSYTWFSKGWKEAFMSGDQEPWVFRGGLTADLQRLIPIDGGNDLFIYKLPDVPLSTIYTIRPYTPMDEGQIYDVYKKLSFDSSITLPENLSDIFVDREIGAFLTLNPELCMVVQNSENEIIGFACATLDSRIFYRNQEICWIPEMREKYPLNLLENEDLHENIKDVINYFHNYKHNCPQDVLNSHPSILRCCLQRDDLLIDQSIAKRVITVLLAALRSNGSFGVHICLNTSTLNSINQASTKFNNSDSNNDDITDGNSSCRVANISDNSTDTTSINLTGHNKIGFYTRLGFTEIYRDTINSCLYLGRNF